MHLQRALLLLAIVLGLTALAASLVPRPSHNAAAPPQPAEPAPPPPAAARPRTVMFRAPAVTRRAPARRARAGTHVVVAVKSTSPGEVEIPALGLTAPVEPGTPATFDLVVPTGRFGVTFAAPLAQAQPIGTLVGTR